MIVTLLEECILGNLARSLDLRVVGGPQLVLKLDVTGLGKLSLQMPYHLLGANKLVLSSFEDVKGLLAALRVGVVRRFGAQSR